MTNKYDRRHLVELEKCRMSFTINLSNFSETFENIDNMSGALALLTIHFYLFTPKTYVIHSVNVPRNVHYLSSKVHFCH